jgi:hypothetical protein
MDLFSIGCIIYYLYVGNELLSFSECVRYRAGNLDLTGRLQKLPERIRPLVVGLTSRCTNDRVAVTSDLSAFFPVSFPQISDQFVEFFRGGTRLEHVLRLSPAFSMIAGSGSVDIRILFVNVFCYFLIRGDIAQEITTFAGFISEFSRPLEDEVKLNRILPYFCSLLSFPSSLVKSNALACIYELVFSIRKLPSGFEPLFSSYLIPMILKSAENPTQQYRLALAWFGPLLAFEVYRLTDELMPDAMKILNFVINETDPGVLEAFIGSLTVLAEAKSFPEGLDIVDDDFPHLPEATFTSTLFPQVAFNKMVLRVYDESLDMKGLKPEGIFEWSHSPSELDFGEKTLIGARVHCDFGAFFTSYLPMIISTLNGAETAIKAGLLRVLREFYDHSKLEDRRKYRNLFLDVAPAILSHLLGERTQATIESYLTFLDWCLKNRLLHMTNVNDVFTRISANRFAEEPVTRFLCDRVARMLPEAFQVQSLPDFYFRIMNQTSKHAAIKMLALKTSVGMEVYQQPLMTKLRAPLSPRFLHSTRLSRSPIAVIAPHHFPHVAALVADASGSLVTVKTDFSTERQFPSLRNVTSMTELRGAEATVLSAFENQLMFIDWSTMVVLHSVVQFDSKVVAFTSRERNIFYGFTEKGVCSLLDTRMPSPVHSIAFDKALTGLSMCSWTESVLIGLGFGEGLVDLVDSRVMLPVKSIQTSRPNFLIPIARNACNFTVASDTQVECFDGFLGNSELRITVQRPIVTGYDGGVLGVEGKRAFYIDPERFEGSDLLFDGGETLSAQLTRQGLVFPKQEEPSLHKHAARVFGLPASREICMSGDKAGFLNFWTVTDPVDSWSILQMC